MNHCNFDKPKTKKLAEMSVFVALDELYQALPQFSFNGTFDCPNCRAKEIVNSPGGSNGTVTVNNR